MEKQTKTIIVTLVIIVALISALIIIVWNSMNKSDEMNVTTNPFLWIIEGDNPSYLFGSIHYADEGLLTLPDIVMDAIDDVDAIYTEVRLDQETNTEISNLTLLPTNQTLEDLLPQGVEERYHSYLSSKALPLQSFSQFKIWSVATAISLLDDIENYLKYGGLDSYIWNLAVNKEKQVDGIETIEEQINVFDTLSLEEQIRLLNETLDSLDEREKIGASSYDFMLDAYVSGDLEAIYYLLMTGFDENDPFYAKLEDRLFTNRNHNMTQRISELIRNNPNTSYFFTIGVGHFYGTEGILELLEDGGFTITRVSFNKCESCDPGEIKIAQRCYIPYGQSTPGEDALNDLGWSNTGYGIGINPPEGWTVDENGLYGDVMFSPPSDDGYYVNLGIIPPAALGIGVTFNDFVDQLLEYYPTAIANYSEVSNNSRIINGLNAYEIVYTFGQGGYNFSGKQVLVEKDGKVCYVTYTALLDLYDVYLSTVEESISSFIMI